jgi:repressor LexA
MLTKQQQRLLFFIKNFQNEHGIAPSYDEMRCALNQKSKSSVHMLLNALVERGFVRKLNNKARAIEVIKFLDRGLALSANESVASKIEATECSVSNNMVKDSSVGHFPFYGKQNTIFPLKIFLSSPEKILSIPKGSFFPYLEGHDYCSIQVSGDALKEMAILDNDVLFFKMGSEAEAGQIVLATVDDENIHMKKWEIKDDKVILSLGSKYMIPQVYEADRVSIKATMVALVRKVL